MQKDERWLDFELIDQYRDTWAKFDPCAMGFIRAGHLTKFLFSLGPPLGWKKDFKNDKKWQYKVIKELNLKTYNNKTRYDFVNVLTNLYMHKVVLELGDM